jgi:spectinomycin phosphotransferase
VCVFRSQLSAIMGIGKWLAWGQRPGLASCPVRDRPAGISDRAVSAALADGWQIRAAAVRYVPVGAGSYHWVVRDSAGGRWFVTVDDLGDKPWLGDTGSTVFAGLRAAMDTALALRTEAGLGFVVAPVPAADGATVRLADHQHAITVFPFLDGASGEFGELPPAAERAELAGLLAALHRATPVATRASRREVGVPLRGVLDNALDELGREWTGGPFAEPARAVLGGAAGQVRRLLRRFDQLAGQVTAAAGEPVITHGEPHPGNLIRVNGNPMLIDWDTVALARPERDLWLIASEDGDELRRYAEASGRTPDPDALALYRLRWTLDDIASFVRELRSPHGRTPGSEDAWRNLNQAIARATESPG